MADYDQFKVGAYTSPLTPDLDNTLLKDCDRPLYEFLRFFVSILNHRLGPRWIQEAQDQQILFNSMPADYFSADGYYGGQGKFIAQYIPYDPIPYLQEQQFKFPLLALYRKDEEEYMRTISWYGSQSTWFLEIILPPLTSKQAMSLTPILNAARKEITDRIYLGWDSCHLDGYQVGQLAQIESISTVSVRYDIFVTPSIKEDQRLKFPFLQIRLAVKERQDSNPGLNQFLELNTNINLDEIPDGQEELPVSEFSMNLGM